MVLKFVVLCGLLASAYGAFSNNGNNYIAGGQEITIQDTPWQVSLQNLGQHFCGGVIINRKNFLTTASCVEDSAIVQNLLVRVGSTRHNYGGVLKAVVRVAIHPQFNRPTLGNNDLAVGTFKYPVFFGLNVQPVRVAAPNTQLSANHTLVLTGWAAPEEGQSLDEIPANLQAAEYRYVPLPECTAAHGNDDEGRPRVTDNNICAIDVNENGNTACNGDTGSPIVVIVPSGVVVQGLVSWNAGCGSDTPPGVFTRLSRYIDWIREQVSAQ